MGRRPQARGQRSSRGHGAHAHMHTHMHLRGQTRPVRAGGLARGTPSETLAGGRGEVQGGCRGLQGGSWGSPDPPDPWGSAFSSLCCAYSSRTCRQQSPIQRLLYGQTVLRFDVSVCTFGQQRPVPLPAPFIAPRCRRCRCR